MGILCNLFLLFVVFVRNSTTYTFENYKDALLKSGDECSAVFKSLDVLAQFKFFDASAKLPVGILQGHFNNFGAYDECLSIDIPEKNVLGKYCTASIATSDLVKHFSEDGPPLDKMVIENLDAANNMSKVLQHVPPVRRLTNSLGVFPFSLGICLPHQCGNHSALIQSLHLRFDESSCTTNKSNSQMSTKALIALYVIIGFAILAVISTIYDIISTNREKDPHRELFIAFSLYTNGKKLCRSSKNSSQLLCLNGLKTLNMIWVIAGHSYGSVIQTTDNSFDVITWIHCYSSMIIAGATVSVDSFFTMGGILSVYTLLRSEDPGLRSNIKNIPLLYLHRYLRLTPAFASVIYISWSGLIPYIADGPMWSIVKSDSEACKESWWAALLYIQNYRSAVECIGQSWYLSVDMQLFLLSPLIWIPLRRWPKFTLRVMVGLVFLGIVIPFGLGYYYKLPATFVGYPSNDYMNIYYMKTHARFSTYVIGMISGYFIYHAKQKKKILINPVALCWIWSITLLVLYGCIYVGYPLVSKEAPSMEGIPTDVDEATRLWNSIYIALLRPAWSVALAVLIYLCVIGYGGPLNWFLSTGPMQFLAKLSYCMYLNHIIFIMIRVGQTRNTFHFGNWEMINILVSIIMTIIPASIVQTLLFESPMIIIEKIIFGKSKQPKQNENTLKNKV